MIARFADGRVVVQDFRETAPSAANSGNLNDGTSGTWEGDFADGGTLTLLPGGKVHDFDPTAAVAQSDTITGDGFLTNP